ncbi:MAG: hypothetical protein N2C14_26085 [Planctomycetales bacterium]
MTTLTPTAENDVRDLFDFLRGQPILFYLAAKLPRHGLFIPLEYDRRDILNGHWLLMAGHGQIPAAELPPPYGPPKLDADVVREDLHQKVAARFEGLRQRPKLSEATLVWYADGDDYPRGLFLPDDLPLDWDTPTQQALFDDFVGTIYG